MVIVVVGITDWWLCYAIWFESRFSTVWYWY